MPAVVRLKVMLGILLAAHLSAAAVMNPYRIDNLVERLGRDYYQEDYIARLSSHGRQALPRLLQGIERKPTMERLMALSRIDPKLGFEVCSRELASSDTGRQLAAVVGLGETHDPRAVEMILPYLEDHAISRYAIPALGHLGGRQAVTALVRIIAQPGAYRWAYGDSNPHGYWAAEALIEIGKPAIPDLISLARTTRSGADFAVDLLGELEAKEAQPMLWERFNNGPEESRQVCAEALASLGDVRVRPYLLDKAAHLPKDMDFGVFDALAHVADARTTDFIIATCREYLKTGRDMPFACLRFIKSDASRRYLEDVVALDYPVWGDMAAQALAKIGDPRSIPVMVAHPVGGPGGISPLARFGERAVRPIIEALKRAGGRDREYLVKALADIGTAEGIDEIRKHRADADAGVAWRCCDVIKDLALYGPPVRGVPEAIR